MTLFLLSLTGIPPTAGFFGKFYVILAAVEAGGWLNVLAVLAVLNAAIAAFYYLRVVVYMFMREPTTEQPGLQHGRLVWTGLAVATVMTIVLGLFPTTLLGIVGSAAAASVARSAADGQGRRSGRDATPGRIVCRPIGHLARPDSPASAPGRDGAAMAPDGRADERRCRGGPGGRRNGRCRGRAAMDGDGADRRRGRDRGRRDGRWRGAGVAGTGVAGGGRRGASSTHAAQQPAPTATPMTRPAAIADFPPIGGERTSTTRSKARCATLDYHSAAMSGRPSSALVRGPHAPAARPPDRARASLLITAGLLSYADPTTAGAVAEPTPSAGRPVVAGPVAVARGTCHRRRPARRRPERVAGREPRAPTKPRHAGHVTRVVVPALKIDLPVVAGPNGYPWCNVAMYIDDLGKPLQDLGGPGAASPPTCSPTLATACSARSTRARSPGTSPTKMLGMIVQVYTSDNKLYLYEIDKVLLHQLTLDAAFAADSEQLGSRRRRGPTGTPGKTQLRRRCCRSATRTRPTRTPRRSPVRLRLIGSPRRRLDPVDPAQEERGHRGADHDEPGDQPEPAALAGPERGAASLMPKIPATAPIPARITVTPVSRFMIVDRLLLTVDR